MKVRSQRQATKIKMAKHFPPPSPRQFNISCHTSAPPTQVAQMSSRPKIKSRSTSLAGAFVHAIIPRNVDAIARKRLFDSAGIDENQCVYCGARRTDWDHFRSLVKAGKPSGYFHTSQNLVPSCGSCNQSKGGVEWKQWMLGAAKGSPSTRKISNLGQRIEKLSVFAAIGAMTSPSLEQMKIAVGPDLWDQYWGLLAVIKEKMNDADLLAKQVSERMEAAFGERARSKDAAS